MASKSPASVLVLASRRNSRWDCLGDLNPGLSQGTPWAKGTLWGQIALILAAAALTGLLGCDSAYTIGLSWNASTSVVAARTY